jgi:transcriptional regulator with XRE-family HTH domain
MKIDQTKLKYVRNNRRLTQDDMANLLNISRSKYQYIESRGNPPEEDIKRIAEVLKCAPEDISETFISASQKITSGDVILKISKLSEESIIALNGIIDHLEKLEKGK